MTSKKIAIYTRVSTKNQKIDSQLSNLREYAKLRGFTIVEEYCDIGVSGTKENRPQLDQLMNDAFKKKFDTVLVFRFDRFARSTKHLTQALSTFKELNIDFISYNENIDTSSPMGQAMFTIISAINQLERDIINERVRAGIKAAKAKGVRLGRPQINKSDQIKALKQEGYSIRAIQRKLNIGAGTVYKGLKA